jgi:hypothetical protein
MRGALRPSRRGLLRGALALAAGGAAAGVSGCDGGRQRPAAPVRTSFQTSGSTEVRWPGHQPGRLYLGVSQEDEDLSGLEAEVGRLGVHRNFFDFWSISEEMAIIRSDHEQARLPWISFKPPVTGPGGWHTVASGAVDDHLRGRARAYDTLSDPVVATFHHEPSGDAAGSAEQFAAAYAHVHDVMLDETGMSNVALVPVVGDWEFNPNNSRSAPRHYLDEHVLQRSAFIGIDLYQNASGAGYDERLGRILGQLDAWGRPDLMVGVGETGCTDAYRVPAVQWWKDSFGWAAANTARVGVISYFNSARNSRSGAYWPLDETAAKTAAFAASARSEVTCLLPA